MADWQNVATPSAGQMSTSNAIGSLSEGLNVAMSIKQLRATNKTNKEIKRIRDSDMSEMDKLQAYANVDLAVATDYAAYLKNAAAAEKAFDPFYRQIDKEIAIADRDFAQNRALSELARGGAFNAQANASNALATSRIADANRTDNQSRIDSERWTQEEAADIPGAQRDEIVSRVMANQSDAAGQRRVDNAQAGWYGARRKREENATVDDSLLNATKMNVQDQLARKHELEGTGTFAVLMSEAERELERIDLDREESEATVNFTKEKQKQLARDSATGRALAINESGAVVATEQGRLQSLNVQDVLAADESEERISASQSKTKFARNKNVAEVAGIRQDTRNRKAESEQDVALTLEQTGLVADTRGQQATLSAEEVLTQKAQTDLVKERKETEAKRGKSIEDIAEGRVNLLQARKTALEGMTELEKRVLEQKVFKVAGETFNASMLAAARRTGIGDENLRAWEEWGIEKAQLIAKGEHDQDVFEQEIEAFGAALQLNEQQIQNLKDEAELALRKTNAEVTRKFNESQARVSFTRAQELALTTTNTAEVDLLKERLINYRNDRYQTNMKNALEREKIQGEIQNDIIRFAEENRQLRQQGDQGKKLFEEKLQEFALQHRLGLVEISKVRQAMRIANSEHLAGIENDATITQARKDLLVAQTNAEHDARIQSNMNAMQMRAKEKIKAELIAAGLSEENAQRIAINEHLLSEAKYDSEIAGEELKKIGKELGMTQLQLDALPSIIADNKQLREQQILEATEDAKAAVSQREQEEYKAFTNRTEAQIGDINLQVARANEAVEMINLAPQIRVHLLDHLDGFAEGQPREEALEDFINRFFDDNPDNNPQGIPDFDQAETRQLIMTPFLDGQGNPDLSAQGLERAEERIGRMHGVLMDKAMQDKATAEDLTHEWNAFMEVVRDPGTPLELVLDAYMKAVGHKREDIIDFTTYSKEKLEQLRQMREGAIKRALETATGKDDGDDFGETLYDEILRGSGG